MSKIDLHRLVDELPEDREDEARLILEHLRDRQEYSIENAPVDDEPLTEEDLATIRQGREDATAGREVSSAELRARLFGE